MLDEAVEYLREEVRFALGLPESEVIAESTVRLQEQGSAKVT
jgi:hypothetical protein